MSKNYTSAQRVETPKTKQNASGSKTKTGSGGKFLNEEDRKALVKEQKQAKAQKAAQLRNQLLARLALLLTDSVMIYMVLAGKIDQPFGVLFVAVLSVLLGYLLK